MINKAILVGTLGKDPMIGKSKNGTEYANFSLATSKKWKDRDGNKQEDTQWHNISCFSGLAKLCQYLEKGSKVYVEGEIKYEKYIDKETGEEKFATKIMAGNISIIKGKEISQHSVDKGNAYQSQDMGSDIPF